MTPVCILRPLLVKTLRSFHHSNVRVCGYGYSLVLNLCNEDVRVIALTKENTNAFDELKVISDYY